MSKVVRQIGFDEGAYVAREKEDVVVGNEIIRHRLSSRVIHWCVAVTFFACLFTGLPVWTPVFGWMATLVGGLGVTRVVHPWFGLGFALASLAMAIHWWTQMEMTKEERGWVGPKLLEYLRDAANHEKIGKYNGGQKVYFHTSGISALGLLASGIVLWGSTSFPAWAREIAILLHNFSFILFAVSLVFHIYLATVAEPGTFNSMTRGTVSKAWARIHHPKWYRDLTGQK
ncbi:MAG TPA: formate dehydrogenase subunit gamma [Thermoanaerobaculia bacterium]